MPLLVALAGCDGRRATPDVIPTRARAAPSAVASELLPPRPAWVPAEDERRLATCALSDVRRSTSLPAFYEASCDGARVLWLPATAAQPARHRPQIALYRLAKTAGLDVVPTTAARVDGRAALLGALPAADVAALSDDPAGRVASAVTRMPDGAIVKTRYGAEGARWSRLASQDGPLPEADARTVADWQRVTALDYVTANLFRDALLLAPDGRLWLVDGSTAFYEHPSPGAADQLLDKLKQGRRVPPGLAAALAKLTTSSLDGALRAGAYEDWLVHHRALGEVALRARAAQGWALATAP